MHVLIINGSPRTPKYSNTEKIVKAFSKELVKKGKGVERYCISVRSKWEEIKDAYIRNTEIIIAMPLYVECVPGILLEFLGTLPVKDEETRVSFILQGGFGEASQAERGVAFLERLPKYLGVRCGGILTGGNNFNARFFEEEEKRVTELYQEIVESYVKDNGFSREVAKKFAGPDYYPLPIRILLGIMFKTTFVKKMEGVALSLGCTKPLNYRPWS